MNPPDAKDESLDRALAKLPPVDLPPWAAAAQLRAATKRLQGRRPALRIERYEPTLLITCSAFHLIWVLWRVIAM